MYELTELQEAFAKWIGPYLAVHEDAYGWRFTDIRAAFEAGYESGRKIHESAT